MVHQDQRRLTSPHGEHIGEKGSKGPLGPADDDSPPGQPRPKRNQRPTCPSSKDMMPAPPTDKVEGSMPKIIIHSCLRNSPEKQKHTLSVCQRCKCIRENETEIHTSAQESRCTSDNRITVLILFNRQNPLY